MKKPSYTDLEKRVQYLDHQNTLLSFYLFDQVKQSRPDAEETSPEGNYSATLYRADSASGGYIIIKPLTCQAVPGVHYLDEIDAKWPTEIRLLADRLRVERQRLLDEQDKRKQSLADA